MTKLIVAAMAALLAWMALPASAAPLEAYGRLPNIEEMEISPDGTKLAMIVTNGEQRRLVVSRVADKTMLVRSDLGGKKVRDLKWAGVQHVLITVSEATNIMDVSRGVGEWSMLSEYNVDTGKARAPLNEVSGASVDVLNTLHRAPQIRTVDGKPMVFLTGVSFPERRSVLALFKSDPARGRTRLEFQGDVNTTGLLVGPDGELMAQTSYRAETGRWSLKLKTKNGWFETGATTALLDEPDLLGLGRDGKTVLVAKDVSEDVRQLYEVGLDGVWSEPLDIDADSMIRDPATNQLMGYRVLRGDEESYVFFGERDQKVWKGVSRAFPDARVSLRSWSADRQKIVVLVDSPTDGPAFYLVDLAAKSADWMGNVYFGVKASDVSPVRPVKFKAADGLDLTGYLTLPRGVEVKTLPLVVFPHGGPAARDEPGFDWWAQAMASRGYAVLQVNYRGSEGFGWAFTKAGFGEWGRKMQTDLSDGVRHLTKEGIVDPKRVCIVGGSYGGYAALAGATIDKGVYRCAASYGGVSDLRRQTLYSRSKGGKPALRYWSRQLAANGPGDPMLAQRSPAQLAAQADIPVLLVHGRDDTVVKLEQSQIMADALTKAGKPVELVVLKGEDHWLTNSGETRLAMLQAVVAFLEKHNPPR